MITAPVMMIKGGHAGEATSMVLAHSSYRANTTVIYASKHKPLNSADTSYIRETEASGISDEIKSAWRT